MDEAYKAIEIVKAMYDEAIREYHKFPVRSIASVQEIARIDALGDVIIALRQAWLCEVRSDPNEGGK